MKTGGYALILDLEEEVRISIGKRNFSLFPSTYVYSGSALNGLDGRVRRHIRSWRQLEKVKRHWHIDYLLPYAKRMTTICTQSDFRTECLLVEYLMAKGFIPVKGFGSSDCRRCPSHLLISPSFRSQELQPATHEETITGVLEAFRSMGLVNVVRHLPKRASNE